MNNNIKENKKIDEVYVHVGAHKTGSTALQHFLYSNKELLLSMGFCYPDVGKEKFANFQHVHLASLLLNDEEDDFISFLESNVSQKKIILSSECFMLRKKSGESLAKNISSLFRIAKNVKIILYIRRQDLWFESFYQEAVKANEKTVKKFNEWIKSYSENTALYDPDWYEVAVDWSSIFGSENVIVRSNEKHNFFGNSIFTDFLHLIGIDSADGFTFPDKNRSNVGFKNRDLLEFMRITNVYNKGVHGISPYFPLLNFLNTSDEYSFFHDSERKKFLNRYKSSNKKLASEIMNISYSELFCPVKETTQEKYEGITIEKTIQTLMKIIFDQNQRLNKLESDSNRNSDQMTIMKNNIIKNGNSILSIEGVEMGNAMLDWHKDHSAKPHTDKEGLHVHPTGNDPFVVMTPIDIEEGCNYLFYLEWEASVVSVLQVYWQEFNNPVFNNQNVKSFKAKKGSNKLWLLFPVEFNGSYRIDPSGCAGEFSLKKLRITKE